MRSSRGQNADTQHFEEETPKQALNYDENNTDEDIGIEEEVVIALLYLSFVLMVKRDRVRVRSTLLGYHVNTS